MVISKENARFIARKLTEKKRSDLEKCNEKISAICYELAGKKIPKDVMEFYNKRPIYLSTYSHVCLTGKGLNFERVHIKDLPSSGDYTLTLSLSDKDATSLAEMISNNKG